MQSFVEDLQCSFDFPKLSEVLFQLSACEEEVAGLYSIIKVAMWRKSRFLASSTEPPKSKDIWDILDVLAKALIPVVLFFGGWAVNNRLTAISQRQTNIRTALELQNGRESSETVLRGSMFTKILEKYSKSGIDEDVRTQLLYLELLVENFNQSLDLTPMIKEVKRNILAQDPSDDKAKMLVRLAALLSSAKSKQLAAISTDGAIKRFTLSEGNRSSINVVLQYCERGASLPLRVPLRVSMIEANSVETSANVEVTRFKRIGGSLNKEISEVSVEPSDLPLIDNMRIGPGIRLSLLPFVPKRSSDGSGFNSNSIGITLMAFPDEMASLKDRPFISDYLESLRQDKEINSDNNPAEAPMCQEKARKLAFVDPNSIDYTDLTLSN